MANGDNDPSVEGLSVQTEGDPVLNRVSRKTVRLRQSVGPHPVLSWKGKDFQVQVPSALHHQAESECREMMKGVTLVCARYVWKFKFRDLSSLDTESQRKCMNL